MARNLTRWAAIGTGLLAGAAGAALWRWKKRRLVELAAGCELLETDRGTIEVARRGSGPPVLVLHGDPGGYDQSLLFGEALFGEDIEIIAPSRPGYLRTPLADNRSPSEQAALFVALLDELGIKQTVVAGISGGGPAALHVAAEYPERVSGLILVSAVTIEIDERSFDIGNPLIDPILTSTPVLDLRTGLFVLLRRFASEHLITLSHRMLSTLEGDALEEYVEFVAAEPDYWQQELKMISSLLPASARIDGTLNDQYWFRQLPLADYEDIECPVLVLHGEFDAAVPISHAEFVAERLSNADLHRLEADHLIGVGPDAENAKQDVQAFIDSISSPGEPMTQ